MVSCHSSAFMGPREVTSISKWRPVLWRCYFEVAARWRPLSVDTFQLQWLWTCEWFSVGITRIELNRNRDLGLKIESKSIENWTLQIVTLLFVTLSNRVVHLLQLQNLKGNHRLSMCSDSATLLQYLKELGKNCWWLMYEFVQGLQIILDPSVSHIMQDTDMIAVKD